MDHFGSMKLFYYKKDLKVLECVYRSTTELGEGLKHKSDEGAGEILSGDRSETFSLSTTA